MLTEHPNIISIITRQPIYTLDEGDVLPETVRITSASKPETAAKYFKPPAEVILAMTQDHPDYGKMKLQILAAHYWGETA